MCAITLAVADGVFVVYLVRSRVYHGHRIVLFTSVLLSTLYVVTHGVEACKTGQISIVTVITASAGIALFVFSRLCSINLMYQLLFGIRAIGNLLQLISATQLLVVTIFFAYFAVRARDVVSGRMESSVRYRARQAASLLPPSSYYCILHPPSSYIFHSLSVCISFGCTFSLRNSLHLAPPPLSLSLLLFALTQANSMQIYMEHCCCD